MTAPILLIAVGNESRGDDALAPLLLRRLRRWLESEGLETRVELLEDFQLQIEHAADIAGRERVLFVDAGMGTPAPYTFRRAQRDSARTLFSHALEPEAVLATYVQVYQQAPPPAYVLCLRGEQFELGSGISPEAAPRLERALKFLQELLQEEYLAAWDARAAAPLAAC